MTTILLAAAVAASTNIVVVASRIDDSAAQLPSPVQVINRDTIAASGAHDLPELLERKANVQVRHLNANPLQSSIAMRGFGENSFGRVKVVYDGEDLNYVDMEAPNLSRVALGNVERVEVIHGPSPVLHGDGAVGGVINVVSDVEPCRGGEVENKITAKAGSQSTFGANFTTHGTTEDLLEYYGGYDYVRSDGDRNHSKYELHNTSGGLKQHFENGSYIGINANYHNGNYELPGTEESPTRNDSVRAWGYGLNLTGKAKLADDQWLYLDGGFAEKYRHARWGDYGYSNDYTTYSYYLSPRYVNEMDVFNFANKFTLGSDLKLEDYSVRDHSGYGPSKWYFTRSRASLFARDEFFVTDNFSIVAGARLENIMNHYKRSTGVNNMRSHDWESGYELGAVYRPIEGMKTYIKGTRFYRSAFVDEANYTQDGNLLKPETGAELDLGIDYDFAKDWNIGVNGYYSQMEDEIFYNPYAAYSYGYYSGYNENAAGKTRRYGMDAGISWSREKVAEASIKYSIVKAEFASGQYHGKDVPLVPNHRIRAEGGIWLWDEFEVKGGFSFTSSQRLAGDFNNEHDKLRDYCLFDVGARYVPNWCKGLTFGFQMDNLFDRKYYDFAGWSDYSGAYHYPAAGRSFMFTVSYEW